MSSVGLAGAIADSIEEFAAVITNQIQEKTGYDRVMVYQFDPAWNGKVIAESRRTDLPTLLGHHFPASDIPPPARALYTRNLVRVLVNRAARAVPLETSPARAHLPLDLSFSVLRSMSPIHLQYLENLGVQASLTISLLQNGKLWGLIACHHQQPRQLRQLTCAKHGTDCQDARHAPVGSGVYRKPAVRKSACATCCPS